MRILLVINAMLGGATHDAVVPGQSPRKDYLELQRALGADILDLGAVKQRRVGALVQRFFGSSVAQALVAWVIAGRYDAVFADRETSGFVLAALMKLRHRRPRLTMIAHLLSPPKKQLMFRALRLQKAIDCVIVHSSLQERLACKKMGLQSDRVALVPYQADEQFWKPSDAPSKNQICSVGLEYRDYDTLVKAVDGLDVDVVIAAASHWSKHKTQIDSPPRVRVDTFGYEALRTVYDESSFVVVPLYDVDNQAGITVILEAMAMGKAVIVSHARGQTDVVRDRRSRSRFDPDRPSQPDWTRLLGASVATAEGQTGIYVAPGDADELRRAITFLLGHPDEARAMGTNARRVIEETMSLDLFTARLAALIQGTNGARDDRSLLDTVGEIVGEARL